MPFLGIWKYNNHYGEWSKEFTEIRKVVPSRLILKDKGGIYVVYQFVDSNDLRVEISSKKRREYWSFKKTSSKACLFIYCFFGDKKEELREALFSFIPRLLNSHMPSYGSNSRRICTLRLVSMCPVEGKILKFVLPGREQMTCLVQRRFHQEDRR